MVSTLLVLAGTIALVNGGWGELQARPLLVTPTYCQPVA
jgi:hypothetical protein